MKKLAIVSLTLIALAGLSGIATAETAKSTIRQSGVKAADVNKSKADKPKIGEEEDCEPSC